MNDHSASGPFRQIEEADLPQVIALLTASFPRRARAHWEKALATLGALPAIPGCPRYGYVIDDDGVRGVILSIASYHGNATPRQVFTNFSSWCVAPSHRGPLARELFAYAMRDPSITFTNLSPAQHTLKAVAALGFQPWTAGQVVGIGRGKSQGFGGVVPVADVPADAIAASELTTLREHEALGCIAFGVRIDDRVVPMVFLPRKVQRVIPCAQLIYCEHFTDFLHHSRAINAHLARAGYPFLIVDASGPLADVKGRYYPGRSAKYFKGPKPAADVDHTYTEMVYLSL